MKGAACLLLTILVLSSVGIDAQMFGRFGGFGYPGFGGYPRFGYGSGFGPAWGRGRGLAFLGSAALLSRGGPLGRAVGGLGLLGLIG